MEMPNGIKDKTWGQSVASSEDSAPSRASAQDNDPSGGAPRFNASFFRQIFVDGPFGAAVVNREHLLLAVNPRLCQMLEFAEDELTRLTLPAVIHSDDIQKEADYSQSLLEGEIPHYAIELRLMTKHRKPLWILLTASPIRDAGDRGAYSLRIMQEITEYKRAEDELRKALEHLEARNEEGNTRRTEAGERLVRMVAQVRKAEDALLEGNERLLAVVETATDAIIGANGEQKLIMWNSAATRVFGYTAEEALNQPITFLMPERYKERHRRAMEQAIASQRQYHAKRVLEVMGRRKDGTEFPIEVSVSSWKINQHMFFTAIVRDITERKEKEEQLRRAYEEMELRIVERSKDLVEANECLKREVEERTRLEEKLRDTLQFKNKLLSTAATGVFTLDVEGTLTTVNDEFCIITGYQPEEIVGEHYGVLGDTSYLDVIDLSQLDAASSVQRCEGSLLTKDGRVLSVLMNHAPLVSDQGKVTGFIVSFVDVTELIEARDAAEKASLAKAEFLANMSHEIRTPIHGIVGMTELTLNTDLTGEQREYLQAVRTSADSLMSVINDVLDFSKMEAGKLDLADIDFSLRDSIGEAMSTVAVQAHSKGLELLSHISPEIPDALIGDPGRLKQVIVNIVGNAIKFTEEGEVSLAVSMDWERGSEVWLHFTVTDTGIGIPEEKQHRIFRAFEQADSSTTRRFGGTGLGLAISSHLVRKMGGKMWVESEAGAGSTFHFTVHLAAREVAVAPHVAVTKAQLKDVPILVVDDNNTNRRILEEMLVYWGMKPTSVESGPAGLAAIEKAFRDGDPFRLIITDCMMPEMDGFDFAHSIKSDPRFESVPVIMLTSAGQRGDGARCQMAKVAAYLLKPVKQSDLLSAISRLLQAAAGNVVVESLITRHTIRETRRKLRILLAEDNLVNQKVATKMLEKMGHGVTVVANGKAAAEAVGRSIFDVILMDVQMPEMDGLQSTKVIRERERTTGKHIPIIAMTAHAMKGDRERCLEAGMDGYVSKPVNQAELFETLEDIGMKAPVTVPPLESAVEPSGVIDRKAVCEQVGGDEELLREIARIFLQESSLLCSRTREAIMLRDASALERSAHAIKGSVANFSTRGAVQTASSLEASGRDRDFQQALGLFDRLEQELERVRAELLDLINQEKPCAGTDPERNS
ncbi:MAG: PAS domain S-box protein [Thermodesulfobacteriota bacterium]